jgi:hypothetical protein
VDESSYLVLELALESLVTIQVVDAALPLDCLLGLGTWILLLGHVVLG